jgi:hypothetical protein
MSFVFISHASEDKERIAPHLRGLMAHNLRLWIDRAYELGPEFDQQQRITTGESWPSEIERALQECGCVLIFWSRHSVLPHRKVLHDEAGHGLRHGKLIQVVLDAEASAQVNRLFSVLQAESLHKLKTDQDHHRAYQRLASAIRKRLLETRRRQRHLERDVPPHLMPFVVDREPQLSQICNDLAEHLKVRQAALDVPPAPKPAYIFFARNADCPERLAERLKRIDGPDVCDTAGRADMLSWADEIRLNWPHKGGPSPDRFRQQIKALVARKDGPAPRCAISCVQHVRFGERDFLRAWLDAWNEHFARAPDSTIIPLLTINPPDGLLRNARLARMRDEIDRWPGRQPAGTLAITPFLLDDLSPISEFDANGWADSLFGAGPRRAAVDRFVKQTFVETANAMPMQAFADHVMSTDWFKDIAGLETASDS